MIVTPVADEAYPGKSVLRAAGICTVLCDKHGFITSKSFLFLFYFRVNGTHRIKTSGAWTYVGNIR